MMPINSKNSNSNSVINNRKKTWWRKLSLFKSKKDNVNSKSRSIINQTATTQNWRNLSPDEPPLPFLNTNIAVSSFKFCSSEENNYSSELAPISKEKDVAAKEGYFLPSTSLYISQQPSSSARELYTIPELSEMNTTTTNTSNNSSHSGSIIISSSVTPPLQQPTTTATEDMDKVSSSSSQRHQAAVDPLSHHVTNRQEDLFVSPHSQPIIISPPSSSSINPNSAVVVQQQPQQSTILSNKKGNRHSAEGSGSIRSTVLLPQPAILIEDEDDNTSQHIPISEWPSSNIDQNEPQFKGELQGNELKCKLIFCNMLASAQHHSKYHCLYYREEPKEMHLLFDEKENICGIKFIMQNGMREDYLQFRGTPQYIPPELSICATYNYEMADVWALGISLYRMLVGKYPFSQSSSHMELFKKMLNSDFSIPNTLSDDAKDLLRRMLAPESSRASFDLIMFHPWIKSHMKLIMMDTKKKSNKEHSAVEMIREKKKSLALPSLLSSTKKERKMKQREEVPTNTKRKSKVFNVIKKAIRLVFLGPYPPPPKRYYCYYSSTQPQPKRYNI